MNIAPNKKGETQDVEPVKIQLKEKFKIVWEKVRPFIPGVALMLACWLLFHMGYWTATERERTGHAAFVQQAVDSQALSWEGKKYQIQEKQAFERK